MSVERLVFNIGGAKPTRAKLHGRDHLVVPTVAMMAGVLNGSAGPVLYEAGDIEKAISLWNHRPLVVYHPKQTAADPLVLNTRGIGLTLNTAFVENKLRMESWIEEERCKKIDNRVLDRILNGKPVEVSTGLGVDLEMKEGEYGPMKIAYKGIARNHRPDHLAILPDQIGACSIAQGAGLLRNEGQPLYLDALDRYALMAIAGLTPVINETGITNEKSYEERVREVYTLLQARFGYRCSIVAMFGDYFVYDFEGKLYRLGYSSSDKETSIADEPTVVYRTVSYVLSNALATAKDVPPDPKERGMTKTEMVAHLIKNGGYEDSDRTILEGFAEDKLTKLVAKVSVQNTAPAAPTQTAPAGNGATPDSKIVNAAPAAAPVVQTEDQWIASAPPAVRRMIANAKSVETAERTRLTTAIKADTRNQYKDEFLANADLDILRGVAAFLPQTQEQGSSQILNFSGAAVPPLGRPATEEAPLGIPVMNFERRAS